VFERYRRFFSIVVAVTDILLINLAVAIAYCCATACSGLLQWMRPTWSPTKPLSPCPSL